MRTIVANMKFLSVRMHRYCQEENEEWFTNWETCRLCIASPLPIARLWLEAKFYSLSPGFIDAFFPARCPPLQRYEPIQSTRSRIRVEAYYRTSAVSALFLSFTCNSVFDQVKYAFIFFISPSGSQKEASSASSTSKCHSNRAMMIRISREARLRPMQPRGPSEKG